MFIQITLLIVGFGLLIKSADWLVDGASSLAKRYNISDLAIGLTIVAFGTSAPELVVNVFAAYQNHEDIVFGNIIGSNNFNLLAILGIAGLISPLIVQSSTVWKEIPISLFAVVLLFILTDNLLDSEAQLLTRLDGVILLIMFAGFLFYVYTQLKSDPVDQSSEQKLLSIPKVWSYIVFGLIGLVVGGKLIVNSAIDMATALGVSEKIVGLTIVAAGTSLPELATSVAAAIKKNNDIAVGNIIGSNIFNIFFILGISALIRPVGYNVVFNTDMYLLGFATLLLFAAMFSGKKKKLDRWEAAVLLSVYVGYTLFLVSKEM